MFGGSVAVAAQHSASIGRAPASIFHLEAPSRRRSVACVLLHRRTQRPLAACGRATGVRRKLQNLHMFHCMRQHSLVTAPFRPFRQPIFHSFLLRSAFLLFALATPRHSEPGSRLFTASLPPSLLSFCHYFSSPLGAPHDAALSYSLRTSSTCGELAEIGVGTTAHIIVPTIPRLLLSEENEKCRTGAGASGG